jgi:F-type H+-transporting ATPase subunit b
MPQMEFADYVPQVIWLILCFGCLYFLMSRLALPRVGEILENRQRKLDHDLESAVKLRDEAAAALAEYQEVMREATLHAEKIISEARDRTQVEAQRRVDDLSMRIEEQVSMSEKKLKALRDSAETEIRLAAIELARATTEKLVGFEVSSEEAASAVKAIAEGR